MESFKTEKEAQDLVDEINSQQPQEFCPLAIATCRVDCVCYRKAFIRKTVTLGGTSERVENFWVHLGECINSMFFED